MNTEYLPITAWVAVCVATDCFLVAAVLVLALGLFDTACWWEGQSCP